MAGVPNVKWKRVTKWLSALAISSEAKESIYEFSISKGKTISEFRSLICKTIFRRLFPLLEINNRHEAVNCGHFANKCLKMTSLDMNTEMAFLIFVLYFVLLLDLYNSLAKLLNANGDKKAKKSQLSRRSHCPGRTGQVKRNDLLTRQRYDLQSEPNVRRDVLFLQKTLRLRSTKNVLLKTRSWGRS